MLIELMDIHNRINISSFERLKRIPINTRMKSVKETTSIKTPFECNYYRHADFDSFIMTA